MIKKDRQKKEETETAENQFPEEAELKECRYCQVMIPKTAKVCPNCRKRQKTNWAGVFLLLLLAAACGAGIYYYLVFYSRAEITASEEVIASVEPEENAESGQSAETISDLEGERAADAGMEAAGSQAAGDAEENRSSVGATEEKENGSSDETMRNEKSEEDEEAEQKPEMQGIGGTEGSKPAVEKGDEAEKNSEAGNEVEKKPEAGDVNGVEKESETGDRNGVEKEPETGNGNGVEKESKAEKESEAGDVFTFEREAEPGEKSEYEEESGTGIEDEIPNPEDGGSLIVTVETTELSDYSEEEFREICQRVDYKKLLRSQETYLNAAVMEELTVVEQVDGGLFDENIYYLCRKEDGQGITRYYIIRDDREEDDMPILAGDVIQVYGQLFGNCKLPGYLVKAQPVVPAVAMVYFDLLEE